MRENVPDMTPEQLEEERAAEQEAIDTAEPLTEEEEKEKEELKGLGFTDWAKREFQAFCRGIELYGRDAYELIQTEVPTKTVDEVREYASAFWERYTEIEGACASSRASRAYLLMLPTVSTSADLADSVQTTSASSARSRRPRRSAARRIASHRSSAARSPRSTTRCSSSR